MKEIHIARKDDRIAAENVRGQIEQLLDTMWRKIGAHHEAISGRAHAPDVEAGHSDTHLRITMELPGVQEKDIEVLVSDDNITIQGEKKAANEEKGWNYYIAERTYGSFRRSFDLPAGADGDKVKATLENGVLTVTVPWKPGTRKTQRSIPITSGSKPNAGTKSKAK